MPESSLYDRLSRLERLVAELARAVDRVVQLPGGAQRYGSGLRVGVAEESIGAMMGGIMKISRFAPGEEEDEGDDDWTKTDKKIRVRNFSAAAIAAGDRVIIGKSSEDGQWYVVDSTPGAGCVSCGPRTPEKWTCSLTGDLSGSYSLSRVDCGWNQTFNDKSVALTIAAVGSNVVLTLTGSGPDGGPATYSLTVSELDCCAEQTLELDDDGGLSGLGSSVVLTPEGGDCACRSSVAGLSRDKLPTIVMNSSTVVLGFDGDGCLGVIENELCPE